MKTQQEMDAKAKNLLEALEYGAEHSCLLRGCEAPHDSAEERASSKEYEYEQFKKWTEEQAKVLCPHGFKRHPGSFGDCHFCVEQEAA